MHSSSSTTCSFWSSARLLVTFMASSVGLLFSITGATAACRQYSGPARCRDAQPDSPYGSSDRSWFGEAKPFNEAEPQSGKALQDAQSCQESSSPCWSEALPR